MADKQTTVALNIGSQRISMAVFEAGKSGGLVLKAYDAESIVADPAMDASRNEQTRVAIEDLAKRLGVGKAKASYAICGQAVFTRFVKLPPIEQDDIEQLVTFEAQQHVPFPLDEVVWDYELVEGSSEKEVVIVAIKSDALDEINLSVNEAGVSTNEVDVAPMALYNAFRAGYGQADESTLILDIGAKTSNLIYIEGQRFFTRSIPIGGVAVTSAIAKEYDVSFMEAEKQKVANGLIALGGGHTEQLEEAVAALAMVIRNSLSRLPAEIARTTNYYRSQHGGSAPRKVLLAGGGANIPYALEFFHEKLNLPVEYFNPVRKLVLAKGVDAGRIQREGHTMGELVGLGMRGIGKAGVHIDLVPSVVEQARADERRKPFLIAAAATLIGGMVIWGAAQNLAATKAEEATLSMQEQRDKLAPVRQQMNALLKKEEKLKEVASAYVKLEADHVQWFDILAELRGAFASDAVWLTDLQPITGYDPSKVLAPDYDPAKAGNGQPVVKEDLAGVKYGESALAELKEAKPQVEDRRSRRRSRKAAKPSAPMIDAVRIRGYWRENPRSQNLVSDLLKKLEGNTSTFQFTIEAASGRKGRRSETVNLTADQYIGKIMSVANVPVDADDLAQPFEITLPLARKVAMK